MTGSEHEHSDDEAATGDASAPGPRTEDEVWAQIVANYGDPVLPDSRFPDAGAETEPGAGAASDVDAGTDAGPDAGTGEPEALDPTGPEPLPDIGERADVSLPDTESFADPDPVEIAEVRRAAADRFVPPPLEPLPRPTPLRAAAWLGALGVPLLVLVAVIASVSVPRIFYGILIGWFVVGFVYLVATMSRHPRDPWDDGSRV